MTIRVRTVVPQDESQWTALFAGYRSFYELPEDRRAVAATWEWIVRGAHGLTGLVATGDDDNLLGIANLRRFARPSTATLGLYLDDLFTAPAARGSGVATALLREASSIAANEGASVVRWITAPDNEAARHVYDDVATATPWVTYDMKPGLRPEV